MKMKWWGWIGIAIAFWPVVNTRDYLTGYFGSFIFDSSKDGMFQIGIGIQMLAVMIPALVGRLAAALMIWISARE